MAPHTRAVSVTIKFVKPGTQPPVYVAGSFSQPPWEPQEMQHKDGEDQDFEFTKNVLVEAGKEYQYKFRMGMGDWWTLDEDAPIVTDSIGNRNNLLSVPAHEEDSATNAKQGVKKSEKETNEISDHPDVTKGSEKEETNMEDHNQQPTVGEVIDAPSAASTMETGKESPRSQTHESGTSPPAAALEIPGTEQSPAKDAAEHVAVIPETSSHLHPQEIAPIESIAERDVNTPGIAEVAAEVADSATLLDHNPPSPIISDEEAGKIGYRRMSSTPIPEVASIAAEVADIAARFDEGSVAQIGLPPASLDTENEDNVDSGASTPEDERVPLFPHECPGPKDKIVESHRDYTRSTSPPEPVEEEEPDLNDPSLVPFPTDREGVYAQIRSLEHKLPPDVAFVPGIPPSLSPGLNRQELPNPSPKLLAEQSYSLHEIAEEKESDEELPAPVTSKSAENLIPPPANENDETFIGAQKPLPETQFLSNQTDSSGDIDVKQAAKTEAPLPKSISKTPETWLVLGHTNQEDLSNKQNETEESDSAVDVSLDTKSSDFVVGGQGVQGEQTVNTPKVKPSTIETASQQSLGSHDGVSNVELENKYGGFNCTPPEIKVVSPEVEDRQLQGAKALGGLGVKPASQPNTPFIVEGERQLGHENGQSGDPLATNAGPTIRVQPATPRTSFGASQPDTPRSSLRNPLNSTPTAPTDSAESTAISSNKAGSDISSRKQRPGSPSSDRPLTPTSIRSTNKDLKEGSFLKMIIRVVFVEWIGGFFKKLFGGGRHSLLVISAIVLVAVVPALYFFG